MQQCILLVDLNDLIGSFRRLPISRIGNRLQQSLQDELMKVGLVCGFQFPICNVLDKVRVHVHVISGEHGLRVFDC